MRMIITDEIVDEIAEEYLKMYSSSTNKTITFERYFNYRIGQIEKLGDQIEKESS